MAIREFKVGTRQQEEWGWLMIFAEVFLGIGSGLTFISLILGTALGMAVGIILVLVGSLFLLVDLSPPRRLSAWRLLTRPQSSWITRGTIGLAIFFILTIVHTAFLAIQPDGWSSLGAPWVAGPAGMKVLGIVAAISALFVATYPGFLLGSMRPMSLWNSAYIPALFLTSALLGGLGIAYLLPLNREGISGTLSVLGNVGGGLIIFELVLLLGLMWQAHPQVTTESVHLFTRGSLRFHFFIGVLLLGLIVPLVILGLVALGAGIAGLLVIAGGLLLIGVFFLRYIIFKASIHVSPV